MKNLYLTIISFAALAMALGSCQMQEPGSGNLKGEVDFSITAGIPGGITTYSPTDGKAFSHLGGINNVSGDYVLRFILEVYDGDAVAYEETQYLDDFSKPQVTFNPRLLAKEYDFVFWADFVAKPSEGSTTVNDLYYSTSNGLTAISYKDNVTGSVLTTDLVDAYYAKEDVNLTQSSQSLQVTLRRPFGKIRLLATDAPQNIENQNSNIPVSATIAFTDAKVPTTFNARTGEASEPDLSVTGYTFTAVKEPSPVVTGHSDLAFAYLLGQTYFFESPSSTAYKMTVTVNNATEQIGYRELTNIPVSANKLTTVIGNFYTNEGNLEVIVEDKFGGGEVLVSAGKWDGTTTADPDIDDDNKTIIISSPDQLAGLAKLVNEGKPYQGYTVTLMANIDLDGHEWTPIGTGIRKDGGYTDESHSFQGTFEGNGNTIYNLSIKADPENADQAIGLFGIVDGGTVENLKFENVNINVPSSEMAAAAVGMLTGGGTVSGIEVVSGSITATRGNGAIVGRMTKSGTIEECINRATVSGSDSNVGGIVGAAYYTEQYSKMIIRNCTNYGEVSCTAPVSVVGGIVGLSAADVINCINEGTITGSGTDVAGIVAEQQNAGSIKGCVNKGYITNSSSAYGTGGIVGWIRYNGATSAYPVKNVIEVSGNTNYGSVQGGNDAGGIVGTVYNFGNITANENYAPTLKATTFAAGIVGNAQFPQGNEGPIGMSGFQEMVNVKDNSTATSLDKITGSCKDLFVYINNQSKVTEENNTLLINTADQFKSFATAVNNGNTFSGINVALGADIDLNNEAWTPIGTNEHPFSGIFDGGGHTVSNLSIAAPDMDYVGLFGITKSTEAVVKNLTLTNVNITGRAQVGSMFGSSYQGTIENCHVNGNISIKGNYKVGGLTGEGYAKIINCSVKGNDGSTVTGVYSAPNIEGDNVGGLIGYTGESIQGHKNWQVKGLTISGTRKVGGAMGYLNYGVAVEGVFVSEAAVSSNAGEDYIKKNAGRIYVGGIVGEYSSSGTLPTISGEIEYTTVTGPTAGARVGGSRTTTYDKRTAILKYLINDESTTATSIWYGESSSSNIMKDEAGKRIIVTDPAGFAALTDYLKTVSGTASYSVVIEDEADVFDLNDKSWTPVRIYDYKGIDGNGIVVRNVKVKVEVDETTGSNAGLFAEVSHISSNDGNIGIRNVNVENAEINGCNSGLGGSAGVLVGSVTLPITNCTVKNSSVTGGDYTGGIVGYSYGDVINCTVSGTTVTGLRKDAGGLIGFLNETRTITGNNVVENTSIGISSTQTEKNIGWLIGRWNFPTGSTLSGNSKDDTVKTEKEVGTYVNGSLQ